MEADFLDGIDEEIAAQTPRDEAFNRLADAVDKLFVKNLQIIDDAAAFRDIDLGDEAPPPEWVKEWGDLEATRRFRLAKAAWLPQKDSPTGFKLATGYVHSYLKLKAAQHAGGQRTLNVVMVAMPAPVLNSQAPKRLFPVQEVDGE